MENKQFTFARVTKDQIKPNAHFPSGDIRVLGWAKDGKFEETTLDICLVQGKGKATNYILVDSAREVLTQISAAGLERNDIQHILSTLKILPTQPDTHRELCVCTPREAFDKNGFDAYGNIQRMEHPLLVNFFNIYDEKRYPSQLSRDQIFELSKSTRKLCEDRVLERQGTQTETVNYGKLFPQTQPKRKRLTISRVSPKELNPA